VTWVASTRRKVSACGGSGRHRRATGRALRQRSASSLRMPQRHQAEPRRSGSPARSRPCTTPLWRTEATRASRWRATSPSTSGVSIGASLSKMCDHGARTLIAVPPRMSAQRSQPLPRRRCVPLQSRARPPHQSTAIVRSTFLGARVDARRSSTQCCEEVVAAAGEMLARYTLTRGGWSSLPSSTRHRSRAADDGGSV